MTALYAFMRHTDDLADNDQPVASRRQALARWRHALHDALGQSAGAPDRSTDPPSRGAPPEADQTAQMLLPAVAATVSRFQIPHHYLDAVIDGVEMDLERSRYDTFDQLAEYCHRVASAVGLACLHIWGFQADQALELARPCGLAFQLTNILRDLKEDAAEDRIYLPQEDLRRWGYSVGDLRRGVVDDRFRRLMAFEVGRAERLYHRGADLFDHLDRYGKRVFGMMVTIYHSLLEEIARCPAQVFRRRVRLGRLRKLAVAARWTLLPARRASLP